VKRTENKNDSYTYHETDEDTIAEPTTNQIGIRNIENFERLSTHTLPDEEVVHREQFLPKT
jgi:hypothetical protein